MALLRGGPRNKAVGAPVHVSVSSGRADPVAEATCEEPWEWLNQLASYEFGVTSQNGEDGIIQGIFTHVGLTYNRSWWHGGG